MAPHPLPVPTLQSGPCGPSSRPVTGPATPSASASSATVTRHGASSRGPLPSAPVPFSTARGGRPSGRDSRAPTGTYRCLRWGSGPSRRVVVQPPRRPRVRTAQVGELQVYERVPELRKLRRCLTRRPPLLGSVRHPFAPTPSPAVEVRVGWRGCRTGASGSTRVTNGAPVDQPAVRGVHHPQPVEV